MPKPLAPGFGFADHLVYVDGTAVGVVEAKKEGVTLYNPSNRHTRAPTRSAESPDRSWRAYSYAELVARDTASLDIFGLRDDSLADSDNLPAPEVIAQEIVDDLEAALEQFRLIAEDLNSKGRVERT